MATHIWDTSLRMHATEKKIQLPVAQSLVSSSNLKQIPNSVVRFVSTYGRAHCARMWHGSRSINSLSITRAALTGLSGSLPWCVMECKLRLLGKPWWAPFRMGAPFPLLSACPCSMIVTCFEHHCSTALGYQVVCQYAQEVPTCVTPTARSTAPARPPGA